MPFSVLPSPKIPSLASNPRRISLDLTALLIYLTGTGLSILRGEVFHTVIYFPLDYSLGFTIRY